MRVTGACVALGSAQGMSKAEALRAAQSDTRARYPHPYYWAGFVLTGHPGEAQAPLGVPLPAIAITGLGVLALLGLAAVRRARCSPPPTRTGG